MPSVMRTITLSLVSSALYQIIKRQGKSDKKSDGRRVLILSFSLCHHHHIYHHIHHHIHHHINQKLLNTIEKIIIKFKNKMGGSASVV